MRKTVLLTRSQKENDILASAISELGFEPISCPTIEFQKLPIDLKSLESFDNIIVTSKFAATIISKIYPHKVNCLCVGEESASILSQNPNIKVTHIANSAEALEYKAQLHNAVYLSGNIVTVPFEKATRCIIYNTIYTENISQDALNAMHPEVKFVLLYSKNCALNLINLLSKYNLLQTVKNSVVIAISSGVASIWEPYSAETLYPEAPQSTEVLKLLVEYERARKK